MVKKSVWVIGYIVYQSDRCDQDCLRPSYSQSYELANLVLTSTDQPITLTLKGWIFFPEPCPCVILWQFTSLKQNIHPCYQETKRKVLNGF